MQRGKEDRTPDDRTCEQWVPRRTREPLDLGEAVLTAARIVSARTPTEDEDARIELQTASAAQ